MEGSLPLRGAVEIGNTGNWQYLIRLTNEQYEVVRRDFPGGQVEEFLGDAETEREARTMAQKFLGCSPCKPRNCAKALERGEKSRQHLMTVKEAAEYLAVSPSTLYGWVWQRKIPFVKLGRSLRFDPADLGSFVESRRTPARR